MRCKYKECEGGGLSPDKIYGFIDELRDSEEDSITKTITCPGREKVGNSTLGCPNVFTVSVEVVRKEHNSISWQKNTSARRTLTPAPEDMALIGTVDGKYRYRIITKIISGKSECTTEVFVDDENFKGWLPGPVVKDVVVMPTNIQPNAIAPVYPSWQGDDEVYVALGNAETMAKTICQTHAATGKWK